MMGGNSSSEDDSDSSSEDDTESSERLGGGLSSLSKSLGLLSFRSRSSSSSSSPRGTGEGGRVSGGGVGNESRTVVASSLVVVRTPFHLTVSVTRLAWPSTS